VSKKTYALEAESSSSSSRWNFSMQNPIDELGEIFSAQRSGLRGKRRKEEQQTRPEHSKLIIRGKTELEGIQLIYIRIRDVMPASSCSA
jgi:hypothetical protein